MRVFITGATGYIGGAVAERIAQAGHEVLALARNDLAERTAGRAGYRPVRGDLHHTERLVDAVRNADAVVHAGNTGGADAGAVDDAAVRAMVGGLEGSGKPFLYTSGVWVLGSTGDTVVDEDVAVNPHALAAWREPLERWLIEAAERGVRTVVIRPGIVYGRGGGIPAMMARGEVPVIGTGDQRWPVVHVDDLAELYLAALLGAPAGTILHGVAGEVVAGALGRSLGAASVSLDAAIAKLGPFAEALALDQRVSAAKTRELLEWEPRAPAILDAIDVAPVRSS